MSHCSHLYTSTTGVPLDSAAAGEGAFVCRARIPLAWPCLFAPGDVQASDGVSDEDGNREGDFLCMVTTPAAAAANLRRRRPSIDQLVDPSFAGLLDALEWRLQRARRPFVMLELVDVVAMGEASMRAAAPGWERTLAGLDEPVRRVRGWARVLRGSGIGASWKVLLAWSNGPDGDNPWFAAGGGDADEIRGWDF